MELKNKALVKTDTPAIRSMYVFLHSRLYHISGNIDWKLHTEEIFVSDVLLSKNYSLPMGSFCLIHPDDLNQVKSMIKELDGHDFNRKSFRVISTYGEVHMIQAIQVEIEEDPGYMEALVAKSLQVFEEEKKRDRSRDNENLQLKAYRFSERITDQAIWYVNSSTHEVYFSDQVFRIHGISPQSLNSHIHSFHSFIHPEDKDAVVQTLDNAYRKHLPVHLHYRIVLPGKDTCYLQHTTSWIYNDFGEMVMMGIMEDITKTVQQQLELEQLKNELHTKEVMLGHMEDTVKMANWKVNLLTRKVIYSDHIYKIYGLKPGNTPVTSNTLMKYVHHDDVHMVQDANNLVLYEFIAPNLEFRIIRPDGKTRWLRQKGKVLVDDNNEMIMIGTIVDITDEELAYNRIVRINREKELQEVAFNQVEEMAGIGSWTWDIDSGEIDYSNGFYELFGYKKSKVQLSQRVIQNLVHAEDKKLFSHQVAYMLRGEENSDFIIRINRHHETRYLHVFFKMETIEETMMFIGTFIDKTEEIQLNHKLNEQVTMSDMLSDASLDMVMLTDLSYYILKWNRKCEDQYNIRKDQAIGRNLFDLFPHWKTSEVINRSKLVMQGETVNIKDMRSVVKGNYNNLLMVPVKDDMGKVLAVLIVIHNTTKELELRKQLTARLQFIEKLLEASVDRVVVLDNNMNYQYWNRKAEQYYGIMKQEVIGRNILELFPGFIDDPSYSEFRKVLKGETIHIPASHNLDNKKGYFETYLIPVKDEKEEVTGILWIVHDLAGEYNLAQQQRKANHILQSINEAFVEVDFSGKVRYLNSQAEKFWKIKSEMALGHTIEDVFSDIAGADIRQAINQALFTRVEIRGEFLNHVDQRWIYLSCTVTGESVIVLSYDIHESKKAGEQLKENRQLMQAIFDTTPFGISLLKPVYDDHGGVKDFIVEMINPAIQQMSSTNVLGKKLTKVFPHILHNGIFKKLVKATHDFQEDFEFRNLEKGNPRWYRTSPRMVNELLMVMIEDITERKLADQEMRRHNDILRYTEYLAQSGSWEYEIQSKKFTWSDGMYKIFGLEKGVEVDPGIYIQYAIEKETSIAERIVHYISESFDPFEELLTIKRGGEERLLKVKGSVVEDEKGNPRKVIGVDVDISQIKMTEDMLKEHQQMMAQTAIASPDSITIYDIRSRQPVYLNNCLAEWTGMTNEELVKIGFRGRLLMVHPDDRKRLMAFNELISSANDGEVKAIEYRIQKKDRVIYLRNRSKVFKRDKEGKVTHILSVLQDISGEMELKQKLEERTRYAESIIDSSIYRVCVFDKDLVIIAWNKRAEVETGMKKEQVIGRKLFEVFPKLKEDKVIYDAMNRSLQGEYVYLPPATANYSQGVYERFYVPIDDPNGNTYAVLNILHDVTFLAQKEEQLQDLNHILEQKNRELEQKHEEISHFSFVASHDLKEPLRKIHTFSDWILEHESQKLSAAGRNYVGKLTASVKQMELLIEDILVLTMIHSDKNKNDEVDLNAVLRKSLAEMNDVIRQTQTSITTDQLGTVRGNLNQCIYLFKNLIGNAIKFQKPGNVPHINITYLFVEGLHHGVNFHELSFEDNGFGFDTKYSSKIFQVFQRLHGKHEFTGTGIGLAICKKIMENHGGFIKAKSTPGQGATFRCYFPA